MEDDQKPPAEEPHVEDPRMRPGGAQGARVDPGLSGIDVDEIPWRTRRPPEERDAPPEDVPPDR